MVVFQLSAKTFFVKSSANGDGSSWEKATDLQPALKAAKAGDEIWVAAGKYTPTKDANRMVAFVIKSGVKVYGGFNGTELTFDARDIVVNETVLSGEIGKPSNEDNSYTVVYTEGVSAATVVDGFTITGGAANYLIDGGDLKGAGAAWFNNGTGTESSPTITNCTFIDNYAREGAAIYNLAFEGKCNPVISKCRFIRNQVDFNGGAIFNDGNDGICNPKITDCIFENNEATYGAGIFNRANFGECKPLINACSFIANASVVKGSGVYNDTHGRGICSPVLVGNRFEEGVSAVGDDVNSNVVFSIQTASEKPAGNSIRMSVGRKEAAN